MLSQFFHPIRLLRRYRQSIAFLPSLLAVAYLLLGLLAVVPNINNDTLPGFLEWLDFKDPGTARSLLSTLIAGMISLMVFSFSMVMTVLSQAGSSFSQKLVFGLVSKREHQRVLGHYLGTILFVLILLMVPFKGETPTLWRSLGVYLGVAMVVHCLGLFVYFIHSVSQSVQINAVTQGLHQSTKDSLEKVRSLMDSPRWRHLGAHPHIQNRHYLINAHQSGYIQQVDLEKLAKLAEEVGVVIHLNFTFGDYTVVDFPLFKVEMEDNDDAATPDADKIDEEFRTAVLTTLTYVQGESVEDLYINGLTQLMEIAIKGLSPGINEPGIARLCIHQLTELLARRLKLEPSNILVDDQGHTRVTWKTQRFDSLLYRLFTPILHYGKEDISINLALLKALKTLSNFAKHDDLDAIQGHADRVIAVLASLTQDSLDRQFIQERLNSGEHRLKLPITLPTEKD